MTGLTRFVLMAFAGGAMAYGATVQGILVDRACGARMASANDQKAAAAHTRECALMPPCTASGYGVLTADGKFVTLDDAGNQKAVAALKASKKTDNVQVQVMGEQSGSSMKVSDIKIL